MGSKLKHLSIEQLEIEERACICRISTYDRQIARNKEACANNRRPYFDKYNWSRLSGQQEKLRWIRFSMLEMVMSGFHSHL